MTSAEKQREYYAQNRERERARCRKWEAANKQRRKTQPSRSLEARREANQRWAAKNKHRHKGYILKYRYGITAGEFERLVAEQRGLCAICSDVLKRPVVDHCHESASVRGLLCRQCNIGLGMFKDNPALAWKAAMYLSRHKVIQAVA